MPLILERSALRGDSGGFAAAVRGPLDGFGRQVPAAWPQAAPPPAAGRIAIVGEAPGKEETIEGRPFVGPSGRLAHQTLRKLGIDPTTLLWTNVFSFQPPRNDPKRFCVRSRDVPAGYPQGVPALQPGWMVAPAWLPEVERLRAELLAFQPTVVLAFGNTACWALFGAPPKISSIRGSVALAQLVPAKVVPTFHPAAVLRQAKLFPVFAADIHKAHFEATFSDIVRPLRQIWIIDRPEEVESFVAALCAAPPATPIGVDIETSTRGGSRQITCVSVALDRERAIVVPIVNRDCPGHHHWADPADEIRCWRALMRLWAEPSIAKVLQNGGYDASWFWTLLRCPLRGWVHDALFAHHAGYPELRHGLGFLGSLYTSEPSWKNMRVKATTKDRAEKRDE